jgi:hypothetical protein
MQNILHFHIETGRQIFGKHQAALDYATIPRLPA